MSNLKKHTTGVTHNVIANGIVEFLKSWWKLWGPVVIAIGSTIWAAIKEAPVWALPVIALASFLLMLLTVNALTWLLGKLKENAESQTQQAKEASLQSAKQEMTQTGINNAPHFEFNPRINIPISQSQTQQQSQSQAIISELNFECVDARTDIAEYDQFTHEISVRTMTGHNPLCKIAVAEFRRNADDSDVSWINVTAIVELHAVGDNPVRIRQGQWLVRDRDERIQRHVTFERFQTKALVVVLATINPVHIFAYDGFYEERGTGYVQLRAYEFVQQLHPLSAPFYDVVIRLLGTKGGRSIERTFPFELVLGTKATDMVFRRKEPETTAIVESS